MKNDQWQSEYEGRFENVRPPLLDLAMEYHRRCEAYDRIVCTGPIGPEGCVLPATPREMGLINRNARLILRELTHRAAEIGGTHQELLETIRRYDERGNYRR